MEVGDDIITGRVTSESDGRLAGKHRMRDKWRGRRSQRGSLVDSEALGTKGTVWESFDLEDGSDGKSRKTTEMRRRAQPLTTADEPGENSSKTVVDVDGEPCRVSWLCWRMFFNEVPWVLTEQATWVASRIFMIRRIRAEECFPLTDQPAQRQPTARAS